MLVYFLEGIHLGKPPKYTPTRQWQCR